MHKSGHRWRRRRRRKSSQSDPSKSYNHSAILRVEFDGYDREEMVRIVVTGNQEPKSVELTESILELDLEEIEYKIVTAMKEAHSKSVMVFQSCLLPSNLGL